MQTKNFLLNSLVSRRNDPVDDVKLVVNTALSIQNVPHGSKG